MSPHIQPEQDSLTRASLVIIGGGGAGLTAALAAVENGIDDVIVIEKRRNVGGNTALAGGMFACESPVQAREKMVADKDVMFKKAMNWARWSQVDPSILRAFINRSGDTIRWLEKHGIEFKLIKLYPDQNPLVQHNPIGGGARLIKTLQTKLKEKGARILTLTQVKRIRLEEGRISGVTLGTEAEDIELKASQVIIASGGFAGNHSLLKKLCPQYYDDMPLSLIHI